MEKSAILFCIDSVGEDAGTERYAVEVALRLDRSRFEVHLGCLEDSLRLQELSRCFPTRVFPIAKVFRPAGWRQLLRLRRYIDEQAIELVHTFMPKSTIVGVLAAKGSGARAVVSSRRNMGYWYTPFYLRLFRYLNRHTTRVLANSERVKQLVVEAERVPAGKVDVLYNGVDMARYAPAAGAAPEPLGIPRAARVVGIVANYRPVKDLPLFLRAARLVADKAPDAAFLLVGQGPLRADLGRLAGELGLAGKVFFTEGQGQVPDYLRGMSIACLSSESEGFSNAILEYMAAGLPVVATDVGGNAEAIEDGLTGYLVRERSPAAFAAPILELLRDEGKRAAMARNSLERCRRCFDLAGAVERQQEYYGRLLAC